MSADEPLSAQMAREVTAQLVIRLEQITAHLARLDPLAVVPMLIPEAAQILRPGAACLFPLDSLEQHQGRTGLQGRFRVEASGCLVLEIVMHGGSVRVAEVRIGVPR